MLTTEFYDLFSKSHLKSYFLGVYSADTIPKSIRRHKFIVVNTSDSTEVGSHWYIIYRVDFNTLEIFDSLGIDTSKRIFLKENFNLRGIKSIKFNTTSVQSNESSTCGHFCVFFIYQRLHNQDLTFHELLNETFEVDCDSNEKNVNNFMTKIING